MQIQVAQTEFTYDHKKTKINIKFIAGILEITS